MRTSVRGKRWGSEMALKQMSCRDYKVTESALSECVDVEISGLDAEAWERIRAILDDDEPNGGTLTIRFRGEGVDELRTKARELNDLLDEVERKAKRLVEVPHYPPCTPPPWTYTVTCTNESE